MQMHSPISVGRSPKTIPGSSYTLKVAHYFFLFFLFFFFISIKKKSNILYHCYNNTFLHVQTFLTATSIDFDPGSAVKAYNEILNLNLNLNIRHF